MDEPATNYIGSRVEQKIKKMRERLTGPFCRQGSQVNDLKSAEGSLMTYRYTLFATVRFNPSAPALSDKSRIFGLSPPKLEQLAVAFLAFAFPLAFCFCFWVKNAQLLSLSSTKSSSLSPAEFEMKSAFSSISSMTAEERRLVRVGSRLAEKLWHWSSSTGMENRSIVSCRLFADICPSNRR